MTRKVDPNTLSLFGWGVAPIDRLTARDRIVVVGAPIDRYATVSGASAAPDTIRAQSFYDQYAVMPSLRIASLPGVDIGNVSRFGLDPLAELADVCDDIGNRFLIVLGGDDAISLPVVTSRADQVIHLDAHSDLWEYPELQHGSWLTAVPREVGVHQYGVRVGPTPRADVLVPYDARTTLVVDIDVCDPAFAPGVGTPVPGGWTSTHLLEQVHWLTLTYPVDTLVVTEVNPSRDLNDMTSLLAQHVIVHALAGLTMRESKRPPTKKRAKK